MMLNYGNFSEKEWALLRERARRAADSAGDDYDETSLTALVVRIGQETFALPIETIAAVYTDTAIVPVPCVPEHVSGIANIRGHIIPVLNLGVLLRVPGAASAERMALVVASQGSMTVAFGVQTIGEVTHLAAIELAPVSPVLDIEKTEYLQGTMPDGTVLLDMVSILADSDLIIDEAPGREW